MSAEHAATDADREVGRVRRLAVRILAAQVAAAVVIALVAWLARDANAGTSALAGGGIGVVANLLMTLQALRPASGPGQALTRMMLGQFAKIAITIAGFITLARTPNVAWLAAIVAYMATLVVFWLVPVLSAPRLPSRSTQR